MASRDYGIDVAIYQSIHLSKYGGKFAVIKGTEGLSYRNPNAVAQAKSARANHMYVDMYHFANFDHSPHRARQEARAAIAMAKRINLAHHCRFLALDWEASANNYIQGSRKQNTDAIVAFMEVIKKAGYKVMLYSGASALRNNVDTARVVKDFGSCLWVASYATMGRIDVPNFNYFPSMNGVAIWQFTDNWRGRNVDGNITLIDVHTNKVAKKKAKPHMVKPKPKATVNKQVAEVYVPVLHNNPNYKVEMRRSSDGALTGKYIRTNTSWKVWQTKNLRSFKCYRIGTNAQWIPAQYCKVTKYK